MYVCMSPPKSTWLILSHSPMDEPYNHNNIPTPSRGGFSLNCNFSIYHIVRDIPINPIKGCWMPIPTRWWPTICHRPCPNQSWRMNVVKFIHLWSLESMSLTCGSYPILKHKAKVNMNLNIHKSQRIWRGRSLHLFLESD
jgi:hypothetical protein